MRADEVISRVWCVAAAAVAATTAMLVVFFATGRASGWLAAAGAVLVFGSSSVPAKHPVVGAAGPLIFQVACSFCRVVCLRTASLITTTAAVSST